MMSVLSRIEARSNTLVKPQRLSMASNMPSNSAAERWSAWSSTGGAKTCTWLFQKPAVTTLPRPSITVAPAGTVTLSRGPIAAMRPSCITTVPASIGGAVGDG